MPSSVIRSFHYDPPTRTLAITFVNGRRYRYFDVPANVPEAMETADSKGEFFNEKIRDHFRYTRDA